MPALNGWQTHNPLPITQRLQTVLQVLSTETEKKSENYLLIIEEYIFVRFSYQNNHKMEALTQLADFTPQNSRK